MPVSWVARISVSSDGRAVSGETREADDFFFFSSFGIVEERRGRGRRSGRKRRMEMRSERRAQVESSCGPLLRLVVVVAEAVIRTCVRRGVNANVNATMEEAVTNTTQGRKRAAAASSARQPQRTPCGLIADPYNRATRNHNAIHKQHLPAVPS